MRLPSAFQVSDPKPKREPFLEVIDGLEVWQLACGLIFPHRNKRGAWDRWPISCVGVCVTLFIGGMSAWFASILSELKASS